MPVELATEGSEFDAVIRNKTIKAKVVKLPFPQEGVKRTVSSVIAPPAGAQPGGVFLYLY